jgi:hypothetical protein
MGARTDVSLNKVTEIAGYKQATAADVKAWAADNGFTVKPGRGRMAFEVIDAYNAAHKRKRTQYVVGSALDSEVEYGYTTAKGRKGKFRARPSEVRAWARENGFEVGDRGRFRAEILDAFGQALRSK